MEPSDIVERLRATSMHAQWPEDYQPGLQDEAAAEIERLRAALAKAKLAEELWRTGGLSSNEAMIEIAAAIRARG